MTFTSLALKAVLIFAGSFVLLWIGAMYGVEEADSTRKENSDELSIQLRKQAIARRAGLQFAALPVIVWIIWTCVRAANSSPD